MTSLQNNSSNKKNSVIKKYKSENKLNNDYENEKVNTEENKRINS